MDLALSGRYLAGLIANRDELENSFMPIRIKFDDERHDLIAKCLVKLHNEESSMSDTVIIETIRSAFFNVSDADEWLASEKNWFEGFVYGSIEMNVSRAEVKELHTILQRQRLSNEAKKILMSMVSKEELEEGDIDAAQDKLRLIKAVYPSKSAQLDEQTAQAVFDALNNSAGIIPYGFKPIDDKIGGACRKEITIIAGRPGHGKTSIVCQFVLNWISQGFKVLFISKEMPIARLLHKFFSNIGNIPANDIKMGSVEDADYLNAIAGAFVDKYKENLFLYDDVYSSSEIEKLVMKHKPDIIVDDFIQLSTFEDGSRDMRTGITQTLKHYKAMAKENNMAFVVLSQLNRSIEGRDDPIPRMSDLAEAGSLEQLAGDICFVYYGYKVDFDETTKNRVQFIISKARYGESTRVPLGFDGSLMRYYAIPNFKSDV